jgi:hypothetical protein
VRRWCFPVADTVAVRAVAVVQIAKLAAPTPDQLLPAVILPPLLRDAAHADAAVADAQGSGVGAAHRRDEFDPNDDPNGQDDDAVDGWSSANV